MTVGVAVLADHHHGGQRRPALAFGDRAEVMNVQPLVAAQPAFAFRGKPRRENPSGWIVETMQAVLQSLVEVGGFENCLVDVVNRGGDADTTGAITGMLAGAMYGRSALPSRWLKALDPEIARRCRDQARQLAAATP